MNVLADNILSNTTQLVLMGVPYKNVGTDTLEAVNAVRDYVKKNNELGKLQRELRINANVNNERAKRARVARLETSLSNSPIKDLIDEGVFQTIIEDLDLVDERFKFKGGLEKKLEPVIDRIPHPLKVAGKTVAMTHDTELYKVLREFTQLSDFTARYVLHKHQTNNLKMPYDESINKIVSTFINYDKPTHKYVQYMNDMGIGMFTKFFFRIQRVIWETAKNNPGKVLVGLGLQTLFFPVPNIMNSAFYNGMNFNDPFSILGSTVDQPLLNLLSSPF